MGAPNPLMSSFRLSYYTLLNLMRRMESSGYDMEHVIKCSFQQYQFESSQPGVSLFVTLNDNTACRTPNRSIRSKAASLGKLLCRFQ